MSWKDFGKPPEPYWDRATKGAVMHRWSWSDAAVAWQTACKADLRQRIRRGETPRKSRLCPDCLAATGERL